jgi:nitrogen-specific signal transduction histidine kinase/CheY-like chemotaxis protein
MTTASADPRALAGELEAARARIAALETELAEARRFEALGRLSRSIAHDFSNIVAAIAGYSELIAEALPGEETLRRRMDAIRRAIDWCQRLSEELVAAGRPSSPAAGVADLNSVVAGAIRTFAPILGADIDVTAELDPRTGAVTVAAGPLERLIVNLLLNARDAMPAGGSIAVGTSPGPSKDGRPTALLRIADTGTGMDEDTRRRAFEPYFTTKPGGKGTGLGLSTVFGVVTQHGGHVDVASEPGRGTVFTVTLPAVACAAPAAAPSSPTVLVIEPEPGVRDLVVEILELHSVRALAARDHREAQRLCVEHGAPLALVIADAGGPDDRAVARVERLLREWPQTPVLYLSSALESAGRARAGAMTLAKPFTVEALIRKVREVLVGPVSD